jgi:hypothetical protein
MSNGITDRIETAIDQLNNSPVASSIFTKEDVISILSAISSGPKQTEAELLTKSKVEFIVKRIVETLAETIENLRTDAVVDEDSIEMTISSGSATLDHISIDTDYLTETILDEGDIERAIWEALEDLEDEA